MTNSEQINEIFSDILLSKHYSAEDTLNAFRSGRVLPIDSRGLKRPTKSYHKGFGMEFSDTKSKELDGYISDEFISILSIKNLGNAEDISWSTGGVDQLIFSKNSGMWARHGDEEGWAEPIQIAGSNIFEAPEDGEPYVRKDGDWSALSIYIETFRDEIAAVHDELVAMIRGKEHYRGYFFTNAEIEAITGEQGDYAYSAESETKWVYVVDEADDANSKWEDTEIDIPDKVMPASDEDPLADADEASAGEENAWSRGDHVHPRVAATKSSLGYVIAGDNIIVDDGTISVMDLIPDVDDVYRIGESNLRYSDIYTRSIHADGLSTDSVSTGSILLSDGTTSAYIDSNGIAFTSGSTSTTNTLRNDLVETGIHNIYDSTDVVGFEMVYGTKKLSIDDEWLKYNGKLVFTENIDLYPNADSTYDIGSPGARYRVANLSSSLNIGEEPPYKAELINFTRGIHIDKHGFRAITTGEDLSYIKFSLRKQTDSILAEVGSITISLDSANASSIELSVGNTMMSILTDRTTIDSNLFIGSSVNPKALYLNNRQSTLLMDVVTNPTERDLDVIIRGKDNSGSRFINTPVNAPEAWTLAHVLNWGTGENYYGTQLATSVNSDKGIWYRNTTSTTNQTPWKRLITKDLPVDEAYRIKKISPEEDINAFDLNTVLLGGGAIFNGSNTDLWYNAPTGFGFGGVINFTGYSLTSPNLSLEMAWDINQTGSVTNKLYYRSANVGGWDNKWKRVLVEEDLDRFYESYDINPSTTVKIGSFTAGAQFVALVSFGEGSTKASSYKVYFSEGAADNLYTVLDTPALSGTGNYAKFIIEGDMIIFKTSANIGTVNLKILSKRNITLNAPLDVFVSSDINNSLKKVYNIFKSPLETINIDDRLTISETKMQVASKALRLFGNTVTISMSLNVISQITVPSLIYTFGNLSEYTPTTPIYATGTIVNSVDRTSQFCGIEIGSGGDIIMVSTESIVAAGSNVNVSLSYTIA